MSIKVLHVAEILRGGTASYLDELITCQKDTLGAGNLSFILPSLHLADVPAVDGLRVYQFKADCARPVRVLRIMRLLGQVLQDIQPDIIHVHGTYAGFAIRLAMLWSRLKPKVVYCAHGWAFDRETSYSSRWLIANVERILARQTDAIVCISEHDKESARVWGLPEAKLVTVHNGISDIDPLLPAVAWPGQGIRFIFVGRFDRQKAVDVLIETIREYPDPASLVLVGSGVLDDYAGDAFPGNVHNAGWQSRPEVNRYLAAADVVVVPSRWEGFGLSALEGMRAGKPVVASRIGGLPELIDDGVTGLLIEPGSKSSLLAALRKIGGMNFRSMGALARARYLEKFTAARMNEGITLIYQRLLGMRDD